MRGEGCLSRPEVSVNLKCLIADARKTFAVAKRCAEEDINGIWDALSDFIVENMEKRKGIFLRGIGTWNLATWKINAGNKHFISVLKPVFHLCGKTGKSFGIIGEKLYTPGKIPVVPMNFATVARKVGMERKDVEDCVSAILMALGGALNENKDVAVKFKGLGTFYIQGQCARFTFTRSFLQKMEEMDKTFTLNEMFLRSRQSQSAASKPYSSNQSKSHQTEMDENEQSKYDSKGETGNCLLKQASDKDEELKKDEPSKNLDNSSGQPASSSNEEKSTGSSPDLIKSQDLFEKAKPESAATLRNSPPSTPKISRPLSGTTDGEFSTAVDYGNPSSRKAISPNGSRAADASGDAGFGLKVTSAHLHSREKSSRSKLDQLCEFCQRYQLRNGQRRLQSPNTKLQEADNQHVVEMGEEQETKLREQMMERRKQEQEIVEYNKQMATKKKEAKQEEREKEKEVVVEPSCVASDDSKDRVDRESYNKLLTELIRVRSANAKKASAKKFAEEVETNRRLEEDKRLSENEWIVKKNEETTAYHDVLVKQMQAKCNDLQDLETKSIPPGATLGIPLKEFDFSRRRRNEMECRKDYLDITKQKKQAVIAAKLEQMEKEKMEQERQDKQSKEAKESCKRTKISKHQETLLQWKKDMERKTRKEMEERNERKKACDTFFLDNKIPRCQRCKRSLNFDGRRASLLRNYPFQ